jgi:hypothetical protein
MAKVHRRDRDTLARRTDEDQLPHLHCALSSSACLFHPSIAAIGAWRTVGESRASGLDLQADLLG